MRVLVEGDFGSVSEMVEKLQVVDGTIIAKGWIFTSVSEDLVDRDAIDYEAASTCGATHDPYWFPDRHAYVKGIVDAALGLKADDER